MAIWPWAQKKEAAEAENKQAIRKRAGVQFMVSLVVAVCLWWFLEHEIIGIVVVCVGGSILLSGLFLPKVFLAIERYVGLFAHYVGVVLTWALLVPFFYLCFLPGHLMIRLCRKDPLKLKWPSGEATYWTPRPPITDPEYFKRQF